MKTEELTMYVANKLKSMRLAQGMTQEDLGIKLNTTKQTIGRYENGSRKISQDLLFELAEIFNCSIDDFFPEVKTDGTINSIFNQLNPIRQRKVYSFAERQLEDQNRKIVPILGQTAANPTELAYDDGIVDEHVSTDVPNQADCALVVNGDSMEPKFKNGSIVFYRSQPTVENGECAIIEIDGTGVTLKKFYYFPENNKVILKSLNDKYGDRELEANRVRILGKAIN